MNVPALSLLLELHTLPWSTPSSSWDEIEAQLADLVDQRRGRGESRRMAEASEAKIAALAQRFEMEPERVREIAAFDPTGGAYTEWLVRNTAGEGLTMPEDGESVREQLAQFHKLKAKSTFDGERDINRLDPGDLFDLLQAYAGTVGKKEKIRNSAAQGVRNLANVDGYQVWEVTTPEAMTALAKDTNWCVKDPKYFHHYKPPFYLVSRGQAKAALYHQSSKQFRAPNDGAILVQKAIPFIPVLAAAGLLAKTLEDAMDETLDTNTMPLIATLGLLQFMSPERLQKHLEKAKPKRAPRPARAADAPPPSLFTAAAFNRLRREEWERQFLALPEYIEQGQIRTFPTATRAGQIRTASAATVRSLTSKSPVALAAYIVADPYGSETVRTALASPFRQDEIVRQAVRQAAAETSVARWIPWYLEVGRDPEFEAALLQKAEANPNYRPDLAEYAAGVLKGRWEEAEPLIAASSAALPYALEHGIEWEGDTQIQAAVDRVVEIDDANHWNDWASKVARPAVAYAAKHVDRRLPELEQVMFRRLGLADVLPYADRWFTEPTPEFTKYLKRWFAANDYHYSTLATVPGMYRASAALRNSMPDEIQDVKLQNPDGPGVVRVPRSEWMKEPAPEKPKPQGPRHGNAPLLLNLLNNL